MFIWMVSHPGQSFFCRWCPILVTAPKLQEDLLGTKVKKVTLTLVIYIDVYSGFWCTSHCVVFCYSVPPLTGQVLGKVLLTSWKIS